MAGAEKHRRNFAIICALIGSAVTLVSLAMTYSVFTESFTDWTPAARRIFTIACCAAVEGTSAGLIYGLVYALAGRAERGVAFLGLALAGGVMGVNIITHSMQVRGIPIEDWQQSYVNWVGPGVLIGVFAVIVALVMVRFETRILRGEREIKYESVEASLDAQWSMIESDDFRNYIDQHKQGYFDKIGRRIGLKPALQEASHEPSTYPKARSR